MIADIARHHAVPVVYVNQVGGNDSLVFDGNSIAFNSAGRIIGRAQAFEEDLALVDIGSRSRRSTISGQRHRGDHGRPWSWASATTCASAGSQAW